VRRRRGHVKRRALRVAVGAAIGALAFASGCGDARDFAFRVTLDRQFDAYVRIVLALGQRDADSLDFYAGPPVWLDRARAEQTPLPEIRRAAAALVDELARDGARTAVDRSRRAFLSRQLAAVVARVDLLTGRHLSFDEESRELFGVDAGTRDPSAFEAARRELDALLPGHGTLAPRYRAFDRRFVVARDRVPVVVTRAVEACRRVTLDHLSLPPNEGVSIEYTHGMPWSAFTRYEGHGRSRTVINLDFSYTVDRLLELACHETYPGHHAINSLIDLPVQPMFSPQTLRTEGAATFAVELAFPGTSRVVIERELFALAGLSPGVGPAGLPLAEVADVGHVETYLRVARLVDRLRWVQVDIARRYLDGDLEFVRAATALEDEALMPEESTEATLKFFNEFRTYAVTYTVGRDLVDNDVRSRSGAARWQAYQDWIRP